MAQLHLQNAVKNILIWAVSALSTDLSLSDWRFLAWPFYLVEHSDAPRDRDKYSIKLTEGSKRANHFILASVLWGSLWRAQKIYFRWRKNVCYMKFVKLYPERIRPFYCPPLEEKCYMEVLPVSGRTDWGPHKQWGFWFNSICIYKASNQNSYLKASSPDPPSWCDQWSLLEFWFWQTYQSGKIWANSHL